MSFFIFSILIVFMIIFAIIIKKRKKKNNKFFQKDMEATLEKISVLQNLYESGEISEAHYHAEHKKIIENI